MRHILVLILLLFATHAYAQQWVEGRIILNDGTTDKGKLNYDIRSGILSFATDETLRNYNARTLAGFKLENNQRQFYSIAYRSPHGVVKQFFELVKEYKDFAVISRTSMLSPQTTSELTTLYFLSAADFRVMPYLEVLNRDVKWRVFESNKTQVRVIDSNLPESIMGDNFEKVKTFAKERKLVWHVKESLLSILDYYESIR